MIIYASNDPQIGFELTGNPDAFWEDGGGQKYLDDNKTTIINDYGNLPNAGIIPETNLVYRGDYALLFEANRRAQLGRWDNITDKKDVTYGMAFMLVSPYNVPSGKFSLLQQFHAKQGVFCSLQVMPNGNFKYRKKYPDTAAGTEDLWKDTEPAPQGSWVTSIMRVVTEVDGLLEFWLNKDPLNTPMPGQHIGPFYRNLFDPERDGPVMYSDVYQSPDILFTNKMVLGAMVAATGANAPREVVDYLTPDKVTLNYHSTPIPVGATVDGIIINSGDMVTMSKGATVKLTVPNKVVV